MLFLLRFFVCAWFCFLTCLYIFFFFSSSSRALYLVLFFVFFLDRALYLVLLYYIFIYFISFLYIFFITITITISSCTRVQCTFSSYVLFFLITWLFSYVFVRFCVYRQVHLFIFLFVTLVCRFMFPFTHTCYFLRNRHLGLYLVLYFVYLYFLFVVIFYLIFDTVVVQT